MLLYLHLSSETLESQAETDTMGPFFLQKDDM